MDIDISMADGVPHSCSSRLLSLITNFAHSGQLHTRSPSPSPCSSDPRDCFARRLVGRSRRLPQPPRGVSAIGAFAFCQRDSRPAASGSAGGPPAPELPGLPNVEINIEPGKMPKPGKKPTLPSAKPSAPPSNNPAPPTVKPAPSSKRSLLRLPRPPSLRPLLL
jgi:hypothetical protein